MSKIGKPTDLNSLKDCEYRDLDYEIVNPSASPVKLTSEQVTGLAIQGAEKRWNNGHIVTGEKSSFEYVASITGCVVASGTSVLNDCGELITTTNDDASVIVDDAPAGNATAYSGGGKFEIGCGPKELGSSIDSSCLTVNPGGAVTGKVRVARCRLSGQLIDCNENQNCQGQPEVPLTCDGFYLTGCNDEQLVFNG